MNDPWEGCRSIDQDLVDLLFEDIKSEITSPYSPHLSTPPPIFVKPMGRRKEIANMRHRDGDPQVECRAAGASARRVNTSPTTPQSQNPNHPKSPLEVTNITALAREGATQEVDWYVGPLNILSARVILKYSRKYELPEKTLHQPSINEMANLPGEAYSAWS